MPQEAKEKLEKDIHDLDKKVIELSTTLDKSIQPTLKRIEDKLDNLDNVSKTSYSEDKADYEKRTAKIEGRIDFLESDKVSRREFKIVTGVVAFVLSLAISLLTLWEKISK